MLNGPIEFQPRVVGRNVVSNTERQRQFRERNPDYYRRLQAKRRARVKVGSAQLLAEVNLAISEPIALPAPVEAIAIPARPFPLMLPAPVVDPLMESLNQLAAALNARREAVEVPISKRI